MFTFLRSRRQCLKHVAIEYALTSVIRRGLGLTLVGSADPFMACESSAVCSIRREVRLDIRQLTRSRLHDFTHDLRTHLWTLQVFTLAWLWHPSSGAASASAYLIGLLPSARCTVP